MGYSLRNIGKLKEALNHIQQSLTIQRELCDTVEMAYCIINSGFIYETLGEISLAFASYSQSFELQKRIGDKKGMTFSLSNIGVLSFHQGDIPKSLQYYGRSLKLREEIGDKKEIAATLINLGTVCVSQEDYSAAIIYYFKSLKLQEEIDEKSGMAISLNSIAYIYYKQNNDSAALAYYNRSLKIVEAIEDNDVLNNALNGLATIYSKNGNFQIALEYFYKCLQIQKSIGDYQGISSSYNNIGQTYLRMKKYLKATAFGDSALATSKKYQFPEQIRDAHLTLSKIDSASGKFGSALEHFKLFVVFRDSLKNESNTKKTIQSQMQYDFDKKSLSDSIRNDEGKKLEVIKHQQEIAKQKTFTYGGIAGFLVMIIVSGISFRAFRNKKKANVLIARQKALVEEKQKEILDSIYYARRIQRALITNENYFSKNLNRLSKN